jgi:protein SCO1/2
MKTKRILFRLTFASASLLFAVSGLRAACCAPAAPAVPVRAATGCCAEEKAGAPLSARSIFQLDASWTDDSGATVQLAALRGRRIIFAMFFARCEYACPMLVSDIQRVRLSLPEAERSKVRVVLVSFDSARDTPAALKTYRSQLDLDSHWTLLRGEPNAVQELAMLLGVKFKPDANGQFSHSNLITLLNPEGEIVHQRAGLGGDVSTLTKAVVGYLKAK